MSSLFYIKGSFFSKINVKVELYERSKDGVLGIQTQAAGEEVWKTQTILLSYRATSIPSSTFKMCPPNWK